MARPTRTPYFAIGMYGGARGAPNVSALDRTPGEEPRLAASELRGQRGADAEHRGQGPDDGAGDGDEPQRAEDQHADDDHGQVAAQPAAAFERVARARAGDQ